MHVLEGLLRLYLPMRLDSFLPKSNMTTGRGTPSKPVKRGLYLYCEYKITHCHKKHSIGSGNAPL